MSDHITVRGRKYYEESYLVLANNNTRRALAALEVRAALGVRNWNRPAEFNKRGLSSAYDSGFERGYRGHLFAPMYSRSHQERAYRIGWETGVAMSATAIERIFADRTKNPRRSGNAESTGGPVEKGRRKPPSQ